MHAGSCASCGWTGSLAGAACPACGRPPGPAVQAPAASVANAAVPAAQVAPSAARSDGFGPRLALLGAVLLLFLGCGVVSTATMMTPAGASLPPAPHPTPRATPLATVDASGGQPDDATPPAETPTRTPRPGRAPTPTHTPTPAPTDTPVPPTPTATQASTGG